MNHYVRKRHLVQKLTNWGYVLACVFLYIIAFWILLAAIWSIASDVHAKTFSVYNLLDEVGLVIFAIALFDVAKYLVIEEVLVEGSPETYRETRQTLTKFTTIIATALSLEGFVLTIETAKVDVQKILFPVAVLLTGAFMIICLGIYHKLRTGTYHEQNK